MPVVENVRVGKLSEKASPSMLLRENPVLQRELLVNLRMHRAFILLFACVALLAAVVMVAWPSDKTIDMSAAIPTRGRRS